MIKNLNSKIVSKKEIDWTREIVIDDLRVDPRVLKMHEERVNNIFKHMSDQEKQQQITNILIKDAIFNRAMDFLVTDYIFNIDPTDVQKLSANLKVSFPDADESTLNTIATKIIQKSLIFDDIKTTFNINVNDEELITILKDYYEKTNKPIRDFMENEIAFNNARDTLLEEKITSFIIEKFPRNLEPLREKLNKQVDEELKNLENGDNK